MTDKFYEMEVIINGVVRVPVDDYESKEHAVEAVEMSDDLIELASNITIQNDKEFYVFVNKRSVRMMDLYEDDNNNTWTFKDKFSEILKENNISIPNLSKLSGIPQNNITMYADGTRIPSNENKKKLMFSLEVLNGKEK